MDKLRQFINATLNGRITPLAYLVAIHSGIFGGAFVFFSNSLSVQSTLLYKVGALVGIPVWGWLTLIAALVLIVGMFIKRRETVQAGAFALFTSWIFAAITYGQNELWLQMILAIVTTLYFGYHFLAASLGRLWDYTP
jgi:hypothetical protein